MAEQLPQTAGLSKSEKYDLLLKQCSGLLDQKADWVANTANFCSALKETFGWFWVGVYKKVSDEYLQLGPFQGPVACTFIQKGKGVCGTAWSENRTILVPNVHEFEGHIACSSLSNSEIVLPLVSNQNFWGVLDIDSEHLSAFDEQDKHGLTLLIGELSKYL